MNIKNKLIILLLILLVLEGCKMKNNNNRIIENYFIGTDDLREDMMIYAVVNEYRIGIMPPTIFALGYNEDFIIAKQHPQNSSLSMEREKINYFIIPLKKKKMESPDENKYGPLTKEEFLQKRIEIGIPDSVNFSLVFKDLE